MKYFEDINITIVLFSEFILELYLRCIRHMRVEWDMAEEEI
jgi:hypothetical protein